MNLFDNVPGACNGDSEKQSVIIYFNYGLENDEPFFQLDDRLRKIIARTGAGEYDGHEIAIDNSEGSFYFYGPSAQHLFKTVLPVLHLYSFMKGATAHLCFGAADNNSKTIEIDI